LIDVGILLDLVWKAWVKFDLGLKTSLRVFRTLLISVKALFLSDLELYLMAIVQVFESTVSDLNFVFVWELVSISLINSGMSDEESNIASFFG